TGAVGMRSRRRVEVALAEHRAAASFDDGRVGGPFGGRRRRGLRGGRAGNGKEADGNEADEGPRHQDALKEHSASSMSTARAGASPPRVGSAGAAAGN